MISKIALSGRLLLRLLPAIAIICLAAACAPKAAMAQGASYTASGCDLTNDDGTYSFVGYDYYGNPYYKNTNNVYMYAQRDDQEGRNYYRWYIGQNYQYIDGLFYGNGNDDYCSDNAGVFVDNNEVQPVHDTPAGAPDWNGDLNGSPSCFPTVTAGS